MQLVKLDNLRKCLSVLDFSSGPDVSKKKEDDRATCQSYPLNSTVCIGTSLALFFFAVPRWGKKNMLVHITICSLIGGLSVSTISGVGSAIVLSIQGDNQFKYWFIYFLLGFVTITLVTEIIFLNKALELFNTGKSD